MIRHIEIIDHQMAELLRQKTGTERLAMLDRLWRSARQLLTSAVREQHPEWTHEQFSSEVVRRLSHGAFESHEQLQIMDFQNRLVAQRNA